MNSKFCPVCGTELVPEISVCRKCGATVTPTSVSASLEDSSPHQLGTTLAGHAQRAVASFSDYRGKHPTAVNLSTAVASVIALLLLGSYGLDLSGLALLLLFPLLVGATIPVFKLDPAVSLTDRFGAWVVMAREKVAHRAGAFHRYGSKPCLGGLARIKVWTEGISDRYVQSGVRLASYLYFSLIAVYVALFALSVMVGVVIAIVMFAVMLWVLWEAFLGGSRSSQRISRSSFLRPVGRPTGEVYRGRKGWLDEPILTIEKNEVYQGRKGWLDEPILTIEGNEIYQGRKGFLSEPIATVHGDEVYRGRKGLLDEPIATIHGNEVYRGRKGLLDEPIATIEGGGRMSAAAAAVYLLLM